ncbi:methylmalonyl-CoA epimerase [Bacteroidota bacterium]|nr:methylmalonyl-CoA epimerase [Bacteroidota bacterium]
MFVFLFLVYRKRMFFVRDMSVKKLEHIGIAVKDLAASELLFTKLLGRGPYKRESVESEYVITSFFQVGDIKIELLAASDPQSTIANFIEKRGEGLHHLAFEVDNIKSSLSEKSLEGFNLIHSEPKDGADNKQIAFLHPNSTGGVLTEFCQDKGNISLG